MLSVVIMALTIALVAEKRKLANFEDAVRAARDLTP
jgi:hypothetical protein